MLRDETTGPEGWDPWDARVWIDPQNPQIVYSTLYEGSIHDAAANVYRSSDAGRTWTRVLEGSGGSLSIYPGDPSIVYASGNGGTWKSTDRGLTWSQVYPARLLGLAVHPNNSDFLLALSNSGPNLAKSTDGGRSWTILLNAVSQALDGSGTIVFIGNPFAEAYRSVDGGASWASVRALADLLRPAGSRGALVNPLNTAEIFHLTETDKGGPDVLYRSTDSGRSFSPFPLPSGATRISDLELDRGSPQTLYSVADNGLWAYTFGEASMGATDTVPSPGSIYGTILSVLGVLPSVAIPILAVVAVASSLVWLDGRRRRPS